MPTSWHLARSQRIFSSTSWFFKPTSFGPKLETIFVCLLLFQPTIPCPFNMSGRTCWCRSHCSDSAPEKVIARNPIHWWRWMSDPIHVCPGLFGHFRIRSVANGWARNEADQRENRIALGVARHMVTTIHSTSFFTTENYLQSSSIPISENWMDLIPRLSATVIWWFFHMVPSFLSRMTNEINCTNCWHKRQLYQNGGLHRPRPWCSVKELSGNPTRHKPVN